MFTKLKFTICFFSLIAVSFSANSQVDYVEKAQSKEVKKGIGIISPGFQLHYPLSNNFEIYGSAEISFGFKKLEDEGLQLMITPQIITEGRYFFSRHKDKVGQGFFISVGHSLGSFGVKGGTEKSTRLVGQNKLYAHLGYQAMLSKRLLLTGSVGPTYHYEITPNPNNYFNNISPRIKLTFLLH